MHDDDCVKFLQMYLPRLGYRWKGFRKVRKRVCKRISHRIRELELADLPSYQYYLERNKDEWRVLDSFCNITISRFYRDRGIFERLQYEILPALAEKAIRNNQNRVRFWSAGCCSGEEPYTLRILWKLSVLPQVAKQIPLCILATDRDNSILERAREGIYPESSFKDLPLALKEQAFVNLGNSFKLKESFKQEVQFLEQDIRAKMPEGEYDLILCRNLLFTYFRENVQREVFFKMMTRLKPGGFFVVGVHESIPEEQAILIPHGKCIYKKSISNAIRKFS